MYLQLKQGSINDGCTYNSNKEIWMMDVLTTQTRKHEWWMYLQLKQGSMNDGCTYNSNKEAWMMDVLTT